MVATVNPCGFALLPAYLSYFLGLDEDDASQSNAVLRALSVSAAVTLGFVVVFGIMGVLWSSVSGWLGTRLPYFTIVIGVGLVVLGIAMLRGYEPVVNLPKLQLSQKNRQLSSMFLYGVSYAVASLSCTIGVFLAVTSTTLRDSSFLQGTLTFVAYGLGMGLTLAVLTISVALAKEGIVANFRSLLPHVHRISGFLLVLAGLFVAYYAWVEVQELRDGTSSSVVSQARQIQSNLQNWAEGQGAARLAIAGVLIIGAALVVSIILKRPAPSHAAGTSDPVEPTSVDSGEHNKR
jgi:cytochrome c biogenesis protein CcdA